MAGFAGNTDTFEENKPVLGPFKIFKRSGCIDYSNLNCGKMCLNAIK